MSATVLRRTRKAGLFPGDVVRSYPVVVFAILGVAILGTDRDQRRVENLKDASGITERTAAGGDDCTDNDGDGYGEGADCLGPDCNDNDSSINPGVSEACDGTNNKCCNGVDDNCDGNIDENATLFARTVDEDAVCIGGANDLDPCTDDADCPDGNCRTPDEIQPAVCDDGPNAGLACTDPADCPDGNCVPGQLTILEFDDLELGDLCIEGLGICAAVGEVVCKQDGTGTECSAEPGTPETEGPAGDPTCFDRVDNDCDGLVDHGNPDEPDRISPCKTDEVCNGFDDDNDGQIDEDFNLGDACTVGVGLCENTGEIICAPDGTTMCNAFPFSPGIETGPGSIRCRDSQDNDCDGTVDLADTGCQEDERCDGRDNDGDSMIDEDFTDLGDPCSAGVGPCQRSGVRVCSADATGTVCDAVAATGSPEGPSGLTCTDGLDNDCDGQLDEADFDCGGLDLTVTCSLPYRLGRPGGDCTGWHTINYSASGGMGELTVVAELQAWTIDGTILDVLPVNDGEDAHLASRLDEEDWKWVTRRNRSRGTWHEMFAPVPMLVVTAQDGKNTVRAYCSNVPFVHVAEPSNSVATSADAPIPVFAAIPLTDVGTLQVDVDGVDVVAGLGLDPATAFPGGPYSGTVDINGRLVDVDDLVVSSGDIDTDAANTVSLTLTGMDCGGHIVTVDADPDPTRFRMRLVPFTSDCHQDDGTASGTASIFLVDVTAPAPGEVTAGGPTNVVGEVCGGKEIANLNINGFDVDVSGQTIEPGDGMTSGDTVRLPFDVMVPEADLRDQIDSGGGSGTFTKGSNRLVAQACDVDAICTYDNFFFAVGPIVPAPTATSFTSAAAGTVAAEGDVERAFVLSITQQGVNNFFEHLKNKNKRCLGDRAKDALRRTRPEREPIEIDGACDPPTTMIVNNTELRNDNFPLSITLHDSATPDPRQGSVEARINLPPIDITASFDGYCESGCVCAFGGCACAVCVTVDLDGRFNQKDMGLEFTWTRDRLLQSGVPREERDPIDFNFDIGTSDPDDFTRIRGEIDIGCLLGFILDVIDFFFKVITFGLWDPGLGSPIVRELTADDIVERLNSLDGDPMDVDLARFENRDLPEFGTRQRDSRVSDAAISSTGLAVSIAAAFAPEPSEIDPAAASIQGTPLKNAPIPTPPILDAQGNAVGDVTIAISDDVFNQLFFSMVQTGRLRTQFEVSRTLGNFIPEDCSTITEDRKRARCIGLRAEDTCNRFCARFDGCEEDCEAAFPYDPGDSNFTNRRQCCRAARIGRNTNILLGTTLILTGRVHNPPKLLIDDDPATNPVEVTLQYDQISITLIADRDGDGMLDPSDTLESLPACTFGDLDAEFGTQSTNQTPCKLWETCLTARLNLSLEMVLSPRGRPRLKFNFESLDRDVPFGVQCGGGYETPDLDFFSGEAGRSQTMDLLEDRLGNSTPPLDTDGLDLGRTVLFQRDRVVAIETQLPAQDDGFQDYIGITGNIVPRENTCGNGVCDTDENEDDCNCPDDCP